MVGSCDDKEGEVVAILVGGRLRVIVLAASSSVLTIGWGRASGACFADSNRAMRSVMLPLVPFGFPERHESLATV